jgi:hypothetical protein
MRKVKNKEITSLLGQIEKMEVTESFFIPGVLRKDVEFIRQPAKLNGIDLKLISVTCDEIYKKSGVRVFRR